MPEVSRFLGMVIAMYYNDHPPPHFHVRYGRHRATLEIGTLRLVDGSLPPRVLGLAVEWASLHRTALAANWALAREQKPLLAIAPLE